MKKWLYILCLTLMGCGGENWFYHQVSYEGEQLHGQMVLSGMLETGKVAEIKVWKSYFLYPDKDETQPVPIDTTYYLLDSQGQYDTISYTTQMGIEYLLDADVQIQINHDGWQQMTRSGREYVGQQVLLAGDTVHIRVAHPDYPDVATVTQIMPLPAVAESLWVDSITSVKYMARLDYHLPPYGGEQTNLMRITALGYLNYISYDSSRGLRQQTTSYSNAVYSNLPGFAAYDLVNWELSAGMYGSCKGLLCDVNKSTNDQFAWLNFMWRPYAYREWTSYDGSEYYYTMERTDSVCLIISTMTRDAYLKYATVSPEYLKGYQPNDPWRNDSRPLPDDMLDNINLEELYDVLGVMEGRQAYSNVQGGIGCVGAITNSQAVWINK